MVKVQLRRKINLVFIVSIYFFLFATPAYSLPLNYLWEFLDTASMVQLDQAHRSYFGFKDSPAPNSYNRETIAYRIHNFCHQYYRKKLKEPASLYRPQIEDLIWNFYLPQIRDLQTKKPNFICQSTPLELKRKTFVEFQLDTKLGFYPIEWKVVNQSNKVEVRQANMNKNGVPDTFIYFDKIKPNCITKKIVDSNQSGNPDINYIYNNCKLVRVEEDYDEDGVKEKICYYNGEEQLINCKGLGAVNQAMAEKYENNNKSKFIYYLNKANEEYYQKFGNSPRHVCGNLLNIMKSEFELGLYEQVSMNYELLLQNSNCNKEKLDAIVFHAFTNLYKLKDYKQAAINYREANKTYVEENGWDSVELSLGLALAYLKIDEPKKCIVALNRIKGRMLNYEGSYMVHYYLGSCHLDAGDYKDAFDHLKRSQAFAENDVQMAQSYLKLGVLYRYLDGGEKQSDEYFNSAIELNPTHENFVKEFKKRKTFLAE
ncbi:MAG: hypothetical protein JJT78_16030 [Leptospira sp.]|nr:hypothetical protein [Leptospira sp.]